MASGLGPENLVFDSPHPDHSLVGQLAVRWALNPEIHVRIMTREPLGDRLIGRPLDFGSGYAGSNPALPTNHGVVGKWIKPPDLQSGDREFKSHLPYSLIS